VLALITNDDGISSDGLRTLAQAAIAAGLEVVVAAPGWDSSGAAASLTAVEDHGRFLSSETAMEGVDARCLSLEASPAFIVRAAIHGSFGTPPDVVLSGVNRGLNCGYSVLHSGTVGAAMTAHTYGVPAIAFSIDSPAAPRWPTAQAVATSVLDWFCETQPGVLLNVNIPDREVADIGGLRRAGLATVGAVTTTVAQVDGGYVTLEYRSNDARAEPGTDVALIQDGYATFTALDPVCESRSADSLAVTELPVAART